MLTFETCHVADQGCERPANLDPDPEERYPRLPECFRCGEPVCKNCSSRRLYKYVAPTPFKWVTKRVRLCNSCQEEEDGTPWHIVYRSAITAGCTPEQASAHANHYLTPAQVKKNNPLPSTPCPTCHAARDDKACAKKCRRCKMRRGVHLFEHPHQIPGKCEGMMT